MSNCNFYSNGNCLADKNSKNDCPLNPQDYLNCPVWKLFAGGDMSDILRHHR